MPWKDGLESKFGDTFRPWTEEDFQVVIGNLIVALPHNHLATIVCYVFLTLLLGVSFSGSASVCSQSVEH